VLVNHFDCGRISSNRLQVTAELMPVAGDLLHRRGWTGNPALIAPDTRHHCFGKAGLFGRLRVGELTSTTNPDRRALWRDGLDRNIVELKMLSGKADVGTGQKLLDDMEHFVGACAAYLFRCAARL